MDQKPKGTPNPLNPNMVDTPLDANPSEPVQPTEMTRPAAPTSSPRPRPVTPTGSPRPRPARPTVPMRSATNLARPRRATVTNSGQPAMNVAASKRAAMGLANSRQPVMNAAGPRRPNRPISAVRTSRPMPGMNKSPSLNSLNSAEKKDTEQIPDLLANLGVVSNVDGSDSRMVAPDNQTTDYSTKTKTSKPHKNKKNKGLVVGIIICLFIAIGCGVAALLLAFNPNKGDAVAAAINKLATGDAPANVAIDGKIDFDIQSEDSPFSSMSIKLGTEATTNSLANSTMATVNASLTNGNEISFVLSEIYTADENLYLKIDGLEDMFNGLYQLNTPSSTEGPEVIDCYIEDGCPSSPNQKVETQNTEYLNLLSSVFGSIEGKWIKIPLENLNSLLPELGGGETTCIKESTESLGKLSGTLVKLYNEYPFVSSTDQNVAVNSIKDPIYKITLNENFANFANKLESSDTGSATCSDSSPSKALTKILRNLQNSANMFAEVDQDYNFTRLYFTTSFGTDANSNSNSADEESVAATVDLRLSYPTSIDTSDPTEYEDLMNIIQNLAGTIYEGQGNIVDNTLLTIDE